VEAAHHDGLEAVRQLAGVLDLGDGAHTGVAVVEARDQQDPAVRGCGGGDGGLGLVTLQGHGHDHAGEHDAGGQREQGQGGGADVVHSER
jgi:hypothetical protein